MLWVGESGEICRWAERRGNWVQNNTKTPYESREIFSSLTHAYDLRSRKPSPVRKFTSSSRPYSVSQHEARTLNLSPVKWIISLNHRHGSYCCIFSVIVPFPINVDGSLSTISHLLYQKAGMLFWIIFK